MIGKLLKIEPDLKDGHIHEAFNPDLCEKLMGNFSILLLQFCRSELI